MQTGKLFRMTSSHNPGLKEVQRVEYSEPPAQGKRWSFETVSKAHAGHQPFTTSGIATLITMGNVTLFSTRNSVYGLVPDEEVL